MRKRYKITNMALIFMLIGMILISDTAHPVDSGFINRLRVRIDDPRGYDCQLQVQRQIEVQNILDKVEINLEDLTEKLHFMYEPIFLPNPAITVDDLRILLHYFWDKNGPEDLPIPDSLVDRVIEERDALGAETLTYIAIGHIGGSCVRKIKGELDFPDDRVEEEAFLWAAFEIALPGISNKLFYLVNNDQPIKDMLEKKKRSLKVLDLGCGPEGTALETLKEKHGDDIETFGINLRITNKKSRHVKLVQGSLKKLRLHFKEDFFDLIYANTVLPYFVKDEEFIVVMREILSVLSPTGKIILLGNDLFERHVIEAQIGGFADLLGINHNLTRPGIPGEGPIVITKKATYRSDPRLASEEHKRQSRAQQRVAGETNIDRKISLKETQEKLALLQNEARNRIVNFAVEKIGILSTKIIMGIGLLVPSLDGELKDELQENQEQWVEWIRGYSQKAIKSKDLHFDTLLHELVRNIVSTELIIGEIKSSLGQDLFEGYIDINELIDDSKKRLLIFLLALPSLDSNDVNEIISFYNIDNEMGWHCNLDLSGESLVFDRTIEHYESILIIGTINSFIRDTKDISGKEFREREKRQEVTIKTAREGHGWIKIEISDDNEGISKEGLPDIFLPKPSAMLSRFETKEFMEEGVGLNPTLGYLKLKGGRTPGRYQYS